MIINKNLHVTYKDGYFLLHMYQDSVKHVVYKTYPDLETLNNKLISLKETPLEKSSIPKLKVERVISQSGRKVGQKRRRSKKD